MSINCKELRDMILSSSYTYDSRGSAGLGSNISYMSTCSVSDVERAIEVGFCQKLCPFNELCMNGADASLCAKKQILSLLNCY